MELSDKYLSIYNFNDSVMRDYVYYKDLKQLEKILGLSLSEYVEVIDGVELIKLNIVKRQLLEHDDGYRNFVADEILYEIDMFGYYGNDEFESDLGEICSLLESDLTPDELGEETWNALGRMFDKSFDKFKYKNRKRNITNKHK